MNGSRRRIYVDHAATTPARAEVVEAMLPHLGELGFNPSSVYAEGRRAKAALDEARAGVARALGARSREIVFTGGGSEANTLAIAGAARALRERRRHVVTSTIEHHAVLHAVEMLRGDGFEVTLVPVDENGRVDLGEFASALRDDTALVSLMLANNEIGTLQPIAEIAELAHARGAVVHTDAVQALGRVPLDVRTLGVDLLTLASHKFYGPKGVGMLYVRSGTPLAAIVVGGGQEAGLRAGTENVAGIVGFAKALELAVTDLEPEAARLRELRDRFEAGVLGTIPGARVNAAGAARLPNVSSLAFSGVDAQALLVRLDLEGVAVSLGSACAAGSSEPSHVLAALGGPEWIRRATVRFSFGRLTGRQEVNDLLAMLPGTIESVRDPVPT
jgi:cysteine desulfurase